MEYRLVVLWLGVYLLLGAAAMPLAAWIFREFSTRGAALSFPLAHAVLFVVAFWVGRVNAGVGALLGGLIALLAGSFLAYRADPGFDTRAYGEAAVVFTIAFTAVVVTRAVDPGIHPFDGERFLDFGLMKTLLRAGTLPPEDMWFAGEPVRYYYGGHFLASLLVRLTGTPAWYGYNLSFAGFCATLITAVYGTAGTIAADRGLSRRIAGLVGAFFVGFASNLFTVGRVFLWALPEKRAIRLIYDVVPIYEEHVLSLGPRHFDYTHAKYVIEGTIMHFPLYAILDGELHPHLLSPPFLVLLVALCYAYYQTPGNEVVRRRFLVFGAVPPVIGTLAVVNTWSFPTGLGLVSLSLFFGPANPGTLLPGRPRFNACSAGARETRRLGTAATVLVPVTLAAVAWVAPFFLFTASGRSVGVVTDRSDLIALLIVYGAFLLVFGLALGQRLWATFPPRWPVATLGVAAIGGVLLLAVGAAYDLAGVALLVPFLVAAWVLLRRSDVGFEGVLVVAGVGIVLIVEFFYVKEQAAPGRFNTVFKSYMQVWVLWAVAAGVLLPAIADEGLPLFGVSPVWRRRLAVGLVIVLVASTSIYGVFALQDHFADGEPTTLDGRSYATSEHPSEAEAIAWLDRRDGQPHIVEAPGTDVYHWVNPASSLTGLPTVAGWSHETAYREAASYHERVRHVEIIYSAEWPAESPDVMHLLRLYEVRYIYVGPEERFRYDPPDYASHPAITVAWRNDEVVIYEVSHRSDTESRH